MRSPCEGRTAIISRLKTKLKGKNLLFIAGGIGLAPLRSVINYVLDNRDDYGTVDILYGSRSADDLVKLKEIQEVWMNARRRKRLPDYRPRAGRLGRPRRLRPHLLKRDRLRHQQSSPRLRPANHDQIRPRRAWRNLASPKAQVYTTLELRMKCGIGKCGRCNIGSKYVCKDGPVFRMDEIDQLPERVLNFLILRNFRTNESVIASTQTCGMGISPSCPFQERL